MKWLILIMLVSCGKHEMPPLPSYETHDKYSSIAHQRFQIQEFESLNGEMTLFSAKSKMDFISVRFKKHSFDREILKIISQDSSLLRPQQYFNEWTKLEFETKNFKIPDQETFDLNLNFVSVNSSPFQVALMTLNGVKTLNTWSPSMTITLTKTEMILLSSGEAHLAVNMYGEKERRGLAERDYYQVMVYDGESTQILYLHQDYSLKNLQKMLGAENAVTTDNVDFRSAEHSQKQWWIRELPTGEVFLARASQSEIKEALLGSFSQTAIEVKRLNGFSTSQEFKTHTNSRHYFKIQVEQKLRTFVDQIEVKKIEAWGNIYENKFTHRMIGNAFIHHDPTIDLDLELEVRENGNLVSGDRFTLTKKKGFWEGALDSQGDNLTFKLISKNEASYNRVGIIAQNIVVGMPISLETTPTHEEEYLTLKIHTFVEKIK